VGRIFLGRGAAQVVVSHELEEFAREAIRRASGHISDRIEETVERVFEKTLADWPIDSGESRAALKSGFRLRTIDGGHAIAGFIRGDADYTYFIRSRKRGKKRGPKDRPVVHAWSEHARKPLDAAGEQLVRDLPEELTERLRAVPR
jgi:hypothetical protein